MKTKTCEIKREGKILYYKKWVEAGAMYIQDLLNDNGELLTQTQFANKFNLKMSFTDYLGLISALPKEWSKKLKKGTTDMQEVAAQLAEKLEGKPKPSRKLLQCITKSYQRNPSNQQLQ